MNDGYINLSVSAGIPPGVVNIVFGTGPRAGDALVGHPDVPLVSFTGSTATAQHITKRSAPYCKKLSLELGGKNPALIFADADLDQCIETTVRSSFSNQVQKQRSSVLRLCLRLLKLVFLITFTIAVIIGFEGYYQGWWVSQNSRGLKSLKLTVGQLFCQL